MFVNQALNCSAGGDAVRCERYCLLPDFDLSGSRQSRQGSDLTLIGWNLCTNSRQIFYNLGCVNKLIGSRSGYAPLVPAVSLKAFVGFPVESLVRNLIESLADRAKDIKSLSYEGF
jgi:hypothetical protein